MAERWVLRIEADGASDADKLRGVAAAQAFLDRAGVTPFEAAAAAFKQEGEVEDISNLEGEHAELWREAQSVALKACCEGWAVLPARYGLNLDQAPPRPRLHLVGARAT